MGLSSAFGADVSNVANNTNTTTVTTTNTTTNAPNITNTITSSAAKTVTKPTKLSQKTIFLGSNYVKNYMNKYGKAPNYVTMDNYKFSMGEFLYLVTKATTYKYKGSKSDVTIKYTIKNPSKATGVNIKGYFKKANYYKVANNVANFIVKNKQIPNYASTSIGKMKYQTLLYAYSRIGAYIVSYNKLPNSAYINVKISHTMNRYLPIYTPTPSTLNISKNNISGNAVWLHSGDVRNVNFKNLSDYGIKNIFVHEGIFKDYSDSYITSWLLNASKNNVKIHVWINCFYNTSSKSWINPIDTKTGTLNQLYFNEIILKVKNYATIPNVAGIHLDYLRYSGVNGSRASDFKYSGGNGGDAITEFVKQLALSTRIVNSKIILSAAVMPEKSVNNYYYGQNYTQLGKYLDVLCPMIYKGNYNAGTTWIQSTTEYIVKNSGGAQVWVGLQSYVSDNNTNRLTADELKLDVLSALNGGANGIAIFRWGIANLFSLI